MRALNFHRSGVDDIEARMGAAAGALETMDLPEYQFPGPQPSRTRADCAAVQAMLALLREGKDLRIGKIEHVKSAIGADDYENLLKLNVAAERVVEAIVGDAISPRLPRTR